MALSLRDVYPEPWYSPEGILRKKGNNGTTGVKLGGRMPVGAFKKIGLREIKKSEINHTLIVSRCPWN